MNFPRTSTSPSEILRNAVYGTFGIGLLALTASPVHARLHLGISSTSYMGQGDEGRQDSYSALDLGLDAKTLGTEIDSRVLVQSQIGFNDSSYRFIEFPELYVATSKKWLAPISFTLGRKIQTWSALDDTWGMGIFQPQFRWDYLRPQQVGLLGLYQEIENGPLHMTLFYSPISIPDRGAPLDFSGGRIRSISPWVVNPPYEIEVMRKQVPVNYDARIPKLGDLMGHHSFAGQIALGEKQGFWGAGSYAYKPMNQLLMSYEADLSLAPSGSGSANAILYPRVAYHHLGTADFGYRGKQVASTLSVMADIPRDESVSLSRTSQKVGNHFSVSPSLRLNPFGTGAKSGAVALSYLRVFGKDLPDVGGLSDGVSSEFDSRYPFKNAFLFSMELPTWRRLTTDLKLVIDMENPGTIVSWYFQYEPERNWRLFLSTDVLSSLSEEGDGTNFIRRYRENDRISGGVSYVF